MKLRKVNAPQFELPFENSPFNLAGQAAPAAPAAAAPAADLVDPRQLEMDKAKSSADYNAPEYKVAKVRDCAWPEITVDNPALVNDFWRAHIETAAWYRQEQEAMVVLLVNCRRKIIGFHLVTLGTKDTCLAEVTTIFRIAIVKNAAAIILGHNHPSGDPSPSEADIKVTRDLIRAGQLLKIEVLDHIIHGTATADRLKPYSSLRELGYFV